MEPFLGEIRIFAFNFVPYGWFPCDGRLLPIAQYSALFSILGTNYGGNGQTNFALPNLAGTTMVSQGQGPGLSDWVVGMVQGTPNVTLTINQMPAHNHPADTKLESTNVDEVNAPPAGGYVTRYSPGSTGIGQAWNTPPLQSQVLMNPMMVGTAGGSMPHNNMQPYLTLLPGIAFNGIFPSRN